MINIITGLYVHSGEPLDNKRGPYKSKQEALNSVPHNERFIGLDIYVVDNAVLDDGVYVSGTLRKFVFTGGISDSDLIELKTSQVRFAVVNTIAEMIAEPYKSGEVYICKEDNEAFLSINDKGTSGDISDFESISRNFLTNTVKSNVAVGAIPTGTTFTKGTKLDLIIQQMLRKYKEPTIANEPFILIAPPSGFSYLQEANYSESATNTEFTFGSNNGLINNMCDNTGSPETTEIMSGVSDVSYTFNSKTIPAGTNNNAVIDFMPAVDGNYDLVATASFTASTNPYYDSNCAPDNNLHSYREDTTKTTSKTIKIRYPIVIGATLFTEQDFKNGSNNIFSPATWYNGNVRNILVDTFPHTITQVDISIDSTRIAIAVPPKVNLEDVFDDNGFKLVNTFNLILDTSNNPHTFTISNRYNSDGSTYVNVNYRIYLTSIKSSTQAQFSKYRFNFNKIVNGL